MQFALGSIISSVDRLLQDHSRFSSLKINNNIRLFVKGLRCTVANGSLSH